VQQPSRKLKNDNVFPATWDEAAMLKFIVVLHRKQGWTEEQFRTYFIEVHQRLAQDIPGLRRYKQNFVLPDPKRARPAWDCVVELYFDSREEMEAAWASPEGQTATADLDVFADLSLTAWSVVEEKIVVG
jgi:uncharacterized protein (TIGR02118 family)